MAANGKLPRGFKFGKVQQISLYKRWRKISLYHLSVDLFELCESTSDCPSNVESHLCWSSQPNETNEEWMRSSDAAQPDSSNERSPTLNHSLTGQASRPSTHPALGLRSVQDAQASKPSETPACLDACVIEFLKYHYGARHVFTMFSTFCWSSWISVRIKRCQWL
jgi:hypothetical protein